MAIAIGITQLLAAGEVGHSQSNFFHQLAGAAVHQLVLNLETQGFTGISQVVQHVYHMYVICMLYVNTDYVLLDLTSVVISSLATAEDRNGFGHCFE